MTTKSDDGDAKKAELRKKFEHQVACEERAHRIVERLIDNPVSEEMFLNSLQYITPNHYKDIVEERCVSKLCGYPLCSNDLGEVIKQKYLISTKTNKVYELEARKSFCGNKCFKASQYLEKQISNAPVWSRKSFPPVRFELLPLDSKIGKLGDEIIVSRSADVKEEVKSLLKLDEYEENLKKKKEEQRTQQSSVLSGQDVNNEDADDIKTKFDNLKIGTDTGQELSDEQRNNASNSVHKSVSESCTSGCKDSIESSRTESGKNKSTKKSKKTGKVSNSAGSADKSKTDYLMQLLDRRKALLSKMVDDQDQTIKQEKKITTMNDNSNPKPRVPDNGQEIVDNVKDGGIESRELEKGGEPSNVLVSEVTESTDVNKDKDGRFEHADSVIGELDKTHESVNKADSVDNDTDNVIPCEVANSSSKQSEEVKSENTDSLKSSNHETVKNESEVLIKTKIQTENEFKSENKAEIRREAQNKNETKNKNIAQTKTQVNTKKRPTSTLEYICTGVKCWVTMETADYLQECSQDTLEVNLGKPEFNKQYKDLVAKVDAQEKDFDALLGEESMDSDVKNQAVAPLPHFDVLKDELAENQKRVEHFMKGSFVYKVTEKNVNLKSDSKDNSIVLPTVDRYDQLYIRQKITLERMSKVLPDVLSPLNLLIQEVFTELKQLVATFNLTSDNIVYKPSEWMLISIILLRMLSRKLPLIDKSFKRSEAVQYFTIMLSGIHGSIEYIDKLIDQILTDDTRT